MSTPALDPSTWLVHTKVQPPVPRSDTIQRQRLLEVLRTSIKEKTLTLVSAPAGYGKTTLLASLQQVLPEWPLAWVSLDQEDNDPARFMATLAAALERLHPSCGQSVRHWLASNGAAGSDIGTAVRRAVAGLINDIVQWLPDPFVLVLDDLHTVTDPGVYIGLEYLMDRQPGPMRIAIGTRHDPPLPLARLAARRQLGELRRPALSFTASEAAQLLNETLGLNLSPHQLGALMERTEGWAVGLCLLASSLDHLATPEARSEFLDGMARTERYVFDFLADEVLRAQEPATRQFLLETSILSELTPAACQAVSDRLDAAALLQELYRRNLFLVMTGTTGHGEASYRYHALFAEFLSRQLALERPDAVVELHRRAAAVQPTPGRAVAHYLAAGLWDLAVGAILQAGSDMLNRGMLETLRSWFAALPTDVRAGAPLVLALMGGCAIHRGDYALAREFLDQALPGLVATGDTEGEGRVLGSLHILAAQDGDFQRLRRLNERALSLNVPLRPITRVHVWLTRAWAHMQEGDWAEAASALTSSLAVVEETADPGAAITFGVLTGPVVAAVPGCFEPIEQFCRRWSTLAGQTPMRLAVDELRTVLQFWHGQVDEAIAIGEAAEAFKESLGGYVVLGSDLAAFLAAAYAVRGRNEAAADAVQRLLHRAQQAPVPFRPYWLHAAARTLCHIGEPERARQIMQRLYAEPDDQAMPLLPYLREHLSGLIAWIDGRYSEAETYLARAALVEDVLPLVIAVGSARLLQCRLWLDQGRQAEALAATSRLLQEWAPDGKPIRILLEGRPVVPLLRAAAEAGDATAASMLLLFGPESDGLAPSSSEITVRHAESVPALLIETLTLREREVLRLVALGASNREIARKLFVGEETVKSHVARILRKLDASSRTQAAAIARSLGLCD